MLVKKSPKARIEDYSKIFLQIGLALALLVVYLGLEFKTYEKEVEKLTSSFTEEIIEEEIPITERIEQIKPPPPPPPAPEKIEVVQDEAEVEETILESTETDQSEAVEVVEIEEITEAVEEEEIPDDVPFAVIEDAPVYPGCKGSKAAKKKCFQEAIISHVGKHFNTGLSEELGLDAGKKKVYVVFRIDHKGTVADIKARGPHSRLEKEAVRVIKLLPKMEPAKQRGKPVGVSYSLPITLEVRT
ncbi:MAG: energy transducer TonB [Flavobacteriales bacterium]|nr:MAG: energy transducer TonB [Flavobacteriales bacterium]PIE49773.1 MAG: energy transducer TonB [Flavobacteriales bacterium]